MNRALFVHACLNGGVRHSLTLAEWDISADCENPYTFSLWWRPNDRERAEGKFPLELIIHNRCHKCTRCLRARERMWCHRAQSELATAQRTWFGTITLRPEEHFKALCRASGRLLARSVQWEDLSEAEQFQYRHWSISRDLTLWLKRVRKNSCAGIRYLLVAEAHKTGLPHYHCLLHEVRGVVTKRILEDAWKLGFTSFKLVEPASSTASYVTKYLTKSALARVRASVHYGTGLDRPTILEENTNAALALRRSRKKYDPENVLQDIILTENEVLKDAKFLADRLQATEWDEPPF